LAAVVAAVPVIAQRGQGTPAEGATAPARPAGPVPRLANGKPDLSGLWANPYTPNMAQRAVDPKTRQPLKFARQGEAIPDAKAPASGTGARTFDLPFTDWGFRKWRDYDPVGKGDYAGNCLPFGLSRNINSPHGVQLIHHPDALAFLFEQNTWHTWVPTNAAFKWPVDLPETWNGTSVGRWEGDTLVIDTTGFNDSSWLDARGHGHSEEMRVEERFHRRDYGHMEVAVTVTDPKVFSKPFTINFVEQLLPDTDVFEHVCYENEKDAAHLPGNASR
jgi:hypothetical protein